MAARLRKTQQQSVRDKIRASQLINFLQNHAVKGTGAENCSSRVRAALGLLAKVLPDQSESSVTHDGAVSLTVVTGVPGGDESAN